MSTQGEKLTSAFLDYVHAALKSVEFNLRFQLTDDAHERVVCLLEDLVSEIVERQTSLIDAEHETLGHGKAEGL